MLPPLTNASRGIHKKMIRIGVRRSRSASMRFATFAAFAYPQPSKLVPPGEPMVWRRELRELLVFVELPRDASTAHECVPRHSQKNDQDWREALAQCVDAIRDLRGIRVPTAVQARSAWRAHGLETRIAGIVGLC